MSIIRASRPENILCEQQARFIQDRISNVETNFGQLCSIFSAYSRKTARLRDVGDELVKVIADYSETESINKSLKQSLAEVANTLSLVEDHRDVQVQRLDIKVIKELSQYDEVCRHSKDEVKNIFSARDRELSRQRNLERLRERNPRNRSQITMAESELIKASAEVARNQTALQEQIDIFEKKKLNDIKTVLLEFMKIELAFHSKAVELYTEAYRDVSQIDERDDLEEFREVLKMPETLSRLETVKRTSFRSSSLQSIANLFSTPQKLHGKNTTGIPVASTSSTDDLVESLSMVGSETMTPRDDSDDNSSSPNSPRISFRK